MVAGAGNLHLEPQTESKLKMARGFKLPKTTPSSIPPSPIRSHLLNLHKQCHQLGTKSSNAQDYGNISLKPPNDSLVTCFPSLTTQLLFFLCLSEADVFPFFPNSFLSLSLGMHQMQGFHASDGKMLHSEEAPVSLQLS